MAIKKYRTSILLALTFTLLLSTFWYMPQLAFIIFISLLLQLLLLPLVDNLSKKLPRALAAGLVLLCFISIAILILGLISKSFIPTFSRFVTDFPQLTEDIQNIPWLKESTFLQSELDDIWAEMKDASMAALKSSLTLLLSLFSKVIDLVIILFVTFYLLKDGEQIKQYLASLFPTNDYSRVMQLFNKILCALRTYICSQLVICCITAIIVFLYFTIRNLPYASVFAVVSGISEFIPVLGPTVASAFGTLLTATVNPLVALQTAGFYLILTQVNHNFIYPTLIGKSLNLHPIAIILGIVLGGELLDAAGMFLAVPFIVICKLVIEDIYKDRVLIREQEKASRWLAKKNTPTK
ncbi:MAG: AI-2E family transporter [Selenomonas sp.]|uniref:AI-2E family transporter n=1 Tax=Selenomonas sp. TaxID=2053611 RepID=UPI0025DA68FC|nr:AI-2E family transporter [Selenomonas sp.]MCR5756307.1 AI-2E family transporter [Selenomonas sp.]